MSSKLDEIFNECTDALSDTQSELDRPKAKQAIKDLFIELADEIPNHDVWYDRFVEKVAQL